ncbi:hypothetical protein HPB49_015071 [Dermacentor silvarum]|uniref:Uncharacterized protein n=1 Tax=Dermacentor silvarum TaxID=543639 RepID=A0ACB8CFY8_DERSI|nr:hypothetical protein HPB49_015071 [Dermacentor silvarum]
MLSARGCSIRVNCLSNLHANVQLEAQSCNFGEPKDFMVRDQLDCGTTDKKLRARLLHEKELTSVKAIDFCKAAEMH